MILGTAVALLAVVIVLYFLGARIVLDGGGGLHVRFVESAATRARNLERHREQQRAQASQAGSPLPAPLPDATAVSPATPGGGGAGAVDADLPPYWTDFRGPARDGVYRERAVLTTWPSAGLTPLWKQPVGEGYASFVIAGGHAFTIEQRADREVVAAYDVRTGRELWTHAWPARFSEMMGGDGPRATPTWSGGMLYALGASGELRCLDAATGRMIWRTNMLEDAGASNLQWGMSAAPLVVDDTVVVLPGGDAGKSIVAYDRRTGKIAWTAQDGRQSYASPMLATIAGERQLLVYSASRVMGLSPANGAIRWEFPWQTQPDVNAAQPIVIGPNRVFVSTGYGKGAAVVEVTPDGTGFAVREVWRNIRMKNQFTSSVLHDGFIYGLDESILACLDAATGELKWKGGRYGYGQLMIAGDRLIVLTEDGDLVLVRATPERHDELSRFTAISGRTWNHPAMADGVLLVRNLREMAAFDLRVK